MAGIEDRLKKDLAEALRSKDEHAKTTIRGMLAALKNEKVAGKSARELDEVEEISVLTKELRKRRESADIYQEAGRQELADKETAEADFIEQYLPAPLTMAELEALVDQQVAEVKSSGEELSMKHMGRIVQAVNQAAAGRAEGKTVAQLVRARLS